jgi:hypothetical protein
LRVFCQSIDDPFSVGVTQCKWAFRSVIHAQGAMAQRVKRPTGSVENVEIENECSLYLGKFIELAELLQLICRII